MHFGKLKRGELIAVIGGALLGIGVFLTWYKTGNGNSVLNGIRGGDRAFSAWDALQITRYLLVAGAAAPFILAYIVLRDHALSWPRGELTAVVAILAITLVVVRGIIIRPGTPPSEISLEIGWFVALAGAIVMFFGAVSRSSQQGGPRKPPGVF